jgi:hypothetical protein
LAAIFEMDFVIGQSGVISPVQSAIMEGTAVFVQLSNEQGAQLTAAATVPEAESRTVIAVLIVIGIICVALYIVVHRGTWRSQSNRMAEEKETVTKMTSLDDQRDELIESFSNDNTVASDVLVDWFGPRLGQMRADPQQKQGHCFARETVPISTFSKRAITHSFCAGRSILDVVFVHCTCVGDRISTDVLPSPEPWPSVHSGSPSVASSTSVSIAKPELRPWGRRARRAKNGKYRAQPPA